MTCRLWGRTSHVIAVRRLWPLLAVLALAAPPASAQNYDDAATPRHGAQVTLLQINDVYSTVPVDGLGGLARVATIKKQVAAAGQVPLLLLGGDFLSSSVASAVFKGEQMIAALNAAGLDIATLGNHEFDFGVDVLVERMKQSRFDWVIANLLDRRTGRPIGDAPPYVMRTVGGLRIGIIGLCLVTDSMASPVVRQRVETIDPLLAAARYVPEMKAAGAEVIVALTHLGFATDRELAARFPDIDVIVGGHEHYPITTVTGRTLITKAGSDARYVARVDLRKREGGPVDRFFELIPVTSAIANDESAASVIDAWEARLGAEFDQPVGSTRVPLDALEATLRVSESNVGNFFADAVRRAVGADVGLVNAGGIRGNRTYPPGPLTRRALVALHPFNNAICKIELTGAELLGVLEHGVSRLPARSGQFPQVSGITLRVRLSAPIGRRVHDVRVGGAPLEPARTYTLALQDFLLRGGDGFEMFGGSRVLVTPESAMPLLTAVEQALAAGPIEPAVEGRIRIEP